MAVRCSLVPHPTTPTSALESVEVSAERLPGGRLRLGYTLRGNRGAIVRDPRGAHPQRQDGLWRDTCFEAFVMAGEGPGYVELNFAFSQDWAAYTFAARREGMADAAVPAPVFDDGAQPHDLSVLVDLGAIEGLGDAVEWRLGLSAVMVDRLRQTSYWALAHPEGPPDFHDPACFTARLLQRKAA